MAVPADPKRPYKAYAATVLAGLSVFVSAWVADTDPFTTKEIVAALVAAVIGSGITGATTYAVVNPPKPAHRAVVRDETGQAGNPLNLLIWLLVVVVCIVLVVWLIRVLAPGA